jgi:LDH2 family malate/lactate/ureidoglycolate dehydrogenase
MCSLELFKISQSLRFLHQFLIHARIALRRDLIYKSQAANLQINWKHSGLFNLWRDKLSVKYTKVNPRKLTEFATRVLETAGIPGKDAETTAKLLVNTDLRGIASHGVAHLSTMYIKGIKDGLINPKPAIKITSGLPATAVIDGDRGLGFVVGNRAMEEAVNRAKITGIGAVSVRNSTHFGACSAYSLLPVKENMIGFAGTTGGIRAGAPGASGPVVGMNALSFAAPSGKGFPFCLDMATPIVAHGKIEVALRTGQQLPLGWEIDPDGNPITDPKDELPKKGSIVMLGSTPELGIYKGFGLNIMVDVLSSIMAASLSIPEIRKQPGHGSECTHFFWAINLSGFLPPEEFKERMDRMIATYHGFPKAKGVNRITIPGELEWEIEQERRQNGIPLDEEVIRSLKDLAKDFKVDYDLD